MKKMWAVATAAVLATGTIVATAQPAEAQRGGRIAFGIGAGLLGVGLLSNAGRWDRGYYGYGYDSRYRYAGYYWRPYYGGYDSRPYDRGYYSRGFASAGFLPSAYYNPRWASYNWSGRQFLSQRFHRHVYYGDRVGYRWRDQGYRSATYYPRRYRYSQAAYYGPRARFSRSDRGFRRAYYNRGYYGPRRSGVRVRVRL